MRKTFALLFLLSFQVTLFAETQSKQLVEMFSVETEPGEGTLTFGSKPEDTEKIQFGMISGHYGLGMVFPGKTLPPPYNKDFKGLQVIQMALGTLKGKLEGKVPQFGALTLIAKTVPTGITTFNFIVPTEKKKHGTNTALLLFTSPNSPADQRDEEKLQKTFFGREGSVRLTPMGTPVVVIIKGDSGKANFKKQLMKVEFQGKLRTPFTDSDRALNGTLQLPVYWPSGKDAEDLARKMSAQSLNPAGSPGAPPAK